MKLTRTYTCRGQITEQETEAGTPAKIRLFDGSFETAFKVTSFKIWSANYSGNTHADAVGKLSISPNSSTGPTNFMQADDSNEIAWSGIQGSIDGGGAMFEVVDSDNLIVEDLYVYARHAGASGPVNYLITLEKYDISETLGAVSMSRDRATESGERWIA